MLAGADMPQRNSLQHLGPEQEGWQTKNAASFLVRNFLGIILESENILGKESGTSDTPISWADGTLSGLFLTGTPLVQGATEKARGAA